MARGGSADPGENIGRAAERQVWEARCRIPLPWLSSAAARCQTTTQFDALWPMLNARDHLNFAFQLYQPSKGSKARAVAARGTRLISSLWSSSSRGS